MDNEQDKAERSPTTKELRKPPQQDFRLLDFFSGNGIEPGSIHGAFEHMAQTSFARGIPDPDGRLINSGAVGFVQRSADELLDRMPGILASGSEESAWKPERVSKAQKHRETAELLARLEPGQVKILRLAFGPADQIPCMKSGAAVARKKENLETIAANDRVEKLGRWRQVLPETEVAKAAFQSWMGSRLAQAHGAEQRIAAIVDRNTQANGWRLDLEAVRAKIGSGYGTDADRFAAAEARLFRRLESVAARDPFPVRVTIGLHQWLVEVGTTKAQSKMLDAAKLEAYRLVKEAWNAWADVRGRRRRAQWLSEPEDLR